MMWNDSATAPIASNTDAVIAVYPTHDGAQDAVVALQRGGFDMSQLSIVGRDYHTDEHVLGYYNSGDRVKFWGKRGAFWGALFTLLMGPALFFVPVVGSLVVLGPLASALIVALEGGAIGGAASALVAALVGIGIPKDSVIRYEEATKADKFLVVAHGTADEAARAREILGSTSPDEVTHHGVMLTEPAFAP